MLPDTRPELGLRPLAGLARLLLRHGKSDRDAPGCSAAGVARQRRAAKKRQTPSPADGPRA
jgi:hypothetical protein